jgi:hypothetical protein
MQHRQVSSVEGDSPDFHQPSRKWRRRRRRGRRTSSVRQEKLAFPRVKKLDIIVH